MPILSVPAQAVAADGRATADLVFLSAYTRPEKLSNQPLPV
jgi:hypothetical protein